MTTTGALGEYLNGYETRLWESIKLKKQNLLHSRKRKITTKIPKRQELECKSCLTSSLFHRPGVGQDNNDDTCGHHNLREKDTSCRIIQQEQWHGCSYKE